MAVLVLLVEKPPRQLGEQKSCPLEHRQHGTQPCSPSCTLVCPIQGSSELSETLLENADGAVVLPCGQPHLRAGAYPPLKLAVCSPTGLLGLPSRAIWMVKGRRDCGSLVVSLWHPSLWLSRLVELLPSFCLTLSLPSSEGSHRGCVRQDLGCLVERFLHVCCFQCNLVYL